MVTLYICNVDKVAFLLEVCIVGISHFISCSDMKLELSLITCSNCDSGSRLVSRQLEQVVKPYPLTTTTAFENSQI